MLTRITLRFSFLATLLVAVAPAQELSAEQKAKVLSGIENVVLQQAFVPGVDLTKWPAQVERQRAAIDAAKRPDQLVGAVNAALREFGISHISMRTPSAERQRRSGQRLDLGLRLQVVKEGLSVLDVTPGSVAASSGLGAGDKIVAIDGKKAERPEDLEGADGTHVVLSVEKPEGGTQEIDLVRKVVSMLRTDTLTWLDESTAVLHVHSFEQGYKRAEIEKLCAEAASARYVLLDLRNNGGGQTNNLRHLLGMFLPTDSFIGTFLSRESARSYASAHGGEEANSTEALAEWWDRRFRTDPRVKPPITARVAVLVNRGSASASEITAAALRECLDAPLVGTPTRGAVLASKFAPLDSGFSLQYPVSDYVTAKGVRLEHQPLAPDLAVGNQRAMSRPTSAGSGAGGGAPASRPQPAPPQTKESLLADPVVKQALALIQKREPHPVPPRAASRPSSSSRPSSGPRQEPGQEPGRDRGQGAPASRPSSRRGGRRGRVVP